MQNRGISRRRFLGQSAKAAASINFIPHPGKVLGANDRIRLGIVGPGDRGSYLMKEIQKMADSQNVELAAVCDIWNQRRDAAADLVHKWTGRRPHQCRKLAELCDLKDIDAVLIATADHQHASLARQAAEAGKDVFVEKPFGCDFEQIKQARDAIRKTNQVVQIGTQRRYQGIPWAARDFIAAGKLGKVSYVEATQSVFGQRWRIHGSENSLTEKDTDWNEFLRYTPKVPFNARHYREFRLFWPYSTGIFCQWMSHAIDLINLVLGEWPKSVISSGGVYLWKDGRINPDTAHCLLEYPCGCLVSYHMRLGNQASHRWITLYGTRGTLDLEAGIAFGEGGGGEVVMVNPGSSIPEFKVNAALRLPPRREGGEMLDAPKDENHLVEFFRCLRSRRRPKADVEAGFSHALATTMAGMSLRMGTKVHYDANKDEIHPREKIQQP